MACEGNCASRTGSLRCSCWSSQCRWSSPMLQTPMWIRLAESSESRKSRFYDFNAFFLQAPQKKYGQALRASHREGSMTTSQVQWSYSVLYKDMDTSIKWLLMDRFLQLFVWCSHFQKPSGICHRLPCATSFFIPRSSSCCRNVSEPVWTSGPWHCTHWRFESTKTYG